MAVVVAVVAVGVAANVAVVKDRFVRRMILIVSPNRKSTDVKLLKGFGF